jgi:short-subunit dehydrogenase
MAITNLRNKQVLITGAASGIGRAAVLAFAKRGAHIIASDLNPTALEALKKEVGTMGVRCMTHVVDVSSEMAMKQFAGVVHATVGAVDVLINNAGIGYLGKFLESDLAHWDRVMKVNVMGVVHGCYYFLPKMIEAGGPRQVLNVASSAANYPMPTMAAYAASKYAVAGFSEVLKMELSGTSVVVTTCEPRPITSCVGRRRSWLGPAGGVLICS